MHIALVDFEWEGHHTAYASCIIDFLLKRNHKVTFLTAGNHDRIDEIPEGNRITVKKLSRTYSTQYPIFDQVLDSVNGSRQILQCFSSVEGGDADLIHFLSFDSLVLPMVFSTLWRSPPIPIVATLHRDKKFDKSALDSIWKVPLADIYHKMVAKSVERLISRNHTDKIVVHSPAIKERLIQNWDIPSEVVHSTHLPTPEIDPKRSKEEARAHLQLPKENVILLFFGGLRHEKGPDFLIKALEGVEQPYTLVFAGSPHDYDESDIKRWRSQIGDVATIVSRLEYIPDSQIGDYFQAADALICPYRRKVGNSGSINFACATDTQIIGPGSSDIGRYLEENGIGQTFEWQNTDSLQTTVSKFIRNADHFPTKSTREFNTKEWEIELEDIYQQTVTGANMPSIEN
jgi:glycosyltransferase involved in cell wall biosynthesis